MRVVPGLLGMRAPARFDAFLSLTVAFLAAWGYDGLAERWRVARSAVPAIAAAVLLGSLLAIELAPRPVHWVRLLGEEDFPPGYSSIRGRAWGSATSWCTATTWRGPPSARTTKPPKRAAPR